jgi:hypothetical protein
MSWDYGNVTLSKIKYRVCVLDLALGFHMRNEKYGRK